MQINNNVYNLIIYNTIIEHLPNNWMRIKCLNIVIDWVQMKANYHSTAKNEYT